MRSWAALSFSDGLVRGLGYPGTSGVLRMPRVVEGSQYLISAAVVILGSTSSATFLSQRFSSQLPRVSICDQQEESSWSAVVPMGCQGHCVVPFPGSVHSKVFVCFQTWAPSVPPLYLGMYHSPEGQNGTNILHGVCRPWSGCLSFLTPAA